MLRFPTILVWLLFPILSFTQVGINTENPLSDLEIVSKGNSPATKNLELNTQDGTEIFSLYDNGNLAFYSIMVGVEAVDMRNNMDLPNPTGNLALHIITTPYSVTSPGIVFQQGSQYNFSTVVSASIILDPGNTIYFSVNSGNSSFLIGPTFASISYSEIP